MLTADAVVANGDTERPRDSATARLGQAWREMRRGAATGVLVEQLFGRPGEADSIEPGHLDVLDILAVQDGQRMSDLAAALRVDPSTVTRTMHRIEAAGLARRMPAEQDGRVVTAHLTEKGRRLHALVAARRSELIDIGLRALTPVEREQLVDLLERFLGALAQATGTAGEPAR
jgi:DNA-binding MarR family transcriptional regulator